MTDPNLPMFRVETAGAGAGAAPDYWLRNTDGVGADPTAFLRQGRVFQVLPLFLFCPLPHLWRTVHPALHRSWGFVHCPAPQFFAWHTLPLFTLFSVLRPPPPPPSLEKAIAGHSKDDLLTMPPDQLSLFSFHVAYCHQCRQWPQGGNSVLLQEMLGLSSGDKLLYVGDHVFGDILK